MKLTEMETQFLLHRLEVPDCIAESLGEVYTNQELVEDTASDLYVEIDINHKLPDFPDMMTMDIIINCLECSTLLAVASSQHESEYRRWLFIGQCVQKKVEKWAGKKVSLATS